jgi:hypothetical protein
MERRPPEGRCPHGWTPDVHLILCFVRQTRSSVSLLISQGNILYINNIAVIIPMRFRFVNRFFLFFVFFFEKKGLAESGCVPLCTTIQ